MIENDVQPDELETFHIYPMGDGFFVRKEEEPETVIDSEPPVKPQPRDHHDAVLIIACSIIMGFIVAFTPNTPVIQQVSILHTFTLGELQSHLLPSVTSSQSVTVATTGRGHQDATRARGTITFYNGLFSSQTIAQGTILTGADGVQVITDQDAFIPAANPPLFSQVSVPAHALHAGAAGNIASYTINQVCCATAVKVLNTDDFIGGRNARDYHTVTKQDIEGAATSLRQILYGQAQTALHVGPDDALIPLPCSQAVTANHHVGEEAATVKVMVATTCSAMAYSRTSLEARARQLLHTPAGFLLQAMSVHVVRTTPTSVIVAIQYTMLYDFTERNGTK